MINRNQGLNLCLKESVYVELEQGFD